MMSAGASESVPPLVYEGTQEPNISITSASFWAAMAVWMV